MRSSTRIVWPICCLIVPMILAVQADHVTGDEPSSVFPEWSSWLEYEDWIYQFILNQNYPAFSRFSLIYASAGDAMETSSNNGGASWQRLTSFSSVDDGDGVGDQGMAIAADPLDPNHLFFSRLDTWHHADGGSGLVESTDGGAT